MKEAEGEAAKSAKQGLLDGASRRRSLGNSKAGRGLLLGFATVVCILLCSSRLLFSFTSLFTHDASNPEPSQQVQPHFVHREAAPQLDEAVGVTAPGSATGVEEEKSDLEELEKLEDVEEESVEDNKDGNESRLPVDDDAELTRQARAGVVDEDEMKTSEDDVEERLDEDGKKTAEEDVEEILTSANVKGGEEKRESGESEAPAEEDAALESAEGDAGEKIVPDAIAFLERLARKLTKKVVKVDNGPYHNRRIFEIEYAEMKRNIRIFVYPFNKHDPFANIYTPITRSPTGNYASEEFFQQALYKSGFVTEDASEANFFFMPVSITKARLDKRIDVAGLKNFCAKYVTGVREDYGYWNRSNGADHFYLSCHSIARSAMDEVPFVRENAIQLLCPSSYYLANYITHKDAAVPQIWPRPYIAPQELTVKDMRTRLAFFAGAANSPVRRELVRVWGKDDKILIHQGKVPYPYSQGLMTSKFCLQAKGFEVNTARLGDSMFYGCVPVVVADYYDLPWQDVLDWSKFSIVVTHADIPLLRKILEEVSDERYAELQKNVMLARKHFIWHNPARQYDAFHMVMYELWKRRHIVRRPTSQQLRSYV